jgi:hypothetical protein
MQVTAKNKAVWRAPPLGLQIASEHMYMRRSREDYYAIKAPVEVDLLIFNRRNVGHTFIIDYVVDALLLVYCPGWTGSYRLVRSDA